MADVYGRTPTGLYKIFYNSISYAGEAIGNNSILFADEGDYYYYMPPGDGGEHGLNGSVVGYGDAGGEAAGARSPQECTRSLWRLVYSSILPGICIIGMLGNVLTLLVLQCGHASHKRQTKVMFRYLSYMSLSDLMVMIVHMFRCAQYGWVTKPPTSKILAHYVFQIDPVVLQTFQMSTSLLVLVITVERFAAVCFPLNAKNWVTHRHSYVVIAAVHILPLLINIPLGIAQEIVPEYSQRYAPRNAWEAHGNEELTREQRLSAFLLSFQNSKTSFQNSKTAEEDYLVFEYYTFQSSAWYADYQRVSLILMNAVIVLCVIVVLLLTTAIMFTYVRTMKTRCYTSSEMAIGITRGTAAITALAVPLSEGVDGLPAFSNTAAITDDTNTTRYDKSSSSHDVRLRVHRPCNRYTSRAKGKGSRTARKSSTKGSSSYSSESNYLLMMLACAACVYLVCWIPYTVVAIIKITRADTSESAMVDTGGDTKEESCSPAIIIEGVSYVLEVSNSALNFYIYCWWSKYFREQVRKMFVGGVPSLLCVCKWKRDPSNAAQEQTRRKPCSSYLAVPPRPSANVDNGRTPATDRGDGEEPLNKDTGWETR